MSNYTKSTNFATKDNLTPGDPLKIVRGTEIDTEFNNISTAVATKTDNSAAAITGGTITGITDLAIADGGTGASTATAAINNLLPSQTSAANKYLQSDGTNVSWDAVTLSTADITGTLAVANGGTGVTSSTGTGNVVLSNSPTLVTPALGTPASGVATNITGLPISTGVSGLGTGVATFLATPSSANLASAVTDETGSGALVFATSPTLVTPALGTPSALVGTNITGTASGLTAGNVTTNANLTGAVTSVGNATSLGSFTSSQLATALTDETGSGANVFATSPTLVTPILGTPTSATLTNATGLPLTTGVTGTLPTANGGTNLTSFTSGGVVYASSTSALTTGSALTFDGTNLGVGKATPSFALDIATATARIRLAPSVTTNAALFQVTNGGGSAYLGLDNSAGTTFTTAYALNIYHGGNYPIIFSTNAAECLRLTSTLLYTASATNIAIGTSSATTGTRLTIQESATNASALSLINRNSTQTWKINVDASAVDDKILAFVDNATSSVRLALTDTGNLGLGVTPSAWSLKAIEVGTVGNAMISGGASDFWMTSNAYYNAGWKYANTNLASGYQQTTGKHIWFTAPSGTAGNAITFTQAMTLDASGNLGVGTTSPSSYGKFAVTGSGTTTSVLDNGAARVTTQVVSGGGSYTQYYKDLTPTYVASVGSYSPASGTAQSALVFADYQGGWTERARIDSSGRLLVGLTSANTSGSNFQVSQGITFPATQSASSDANTLDDYEEGTFSPVLTDGTNNTVAGTGNYTKIGRLVTIQIQLYAVTYTGLTAGSLIKISGLPFSVSGPCNTAISFPNSSYPTLMTQNSSGLLALYTTNGANNTDWQSVTRTLLGGSTISMYASITYFV